MKVIDVLDSPWAILPEKLAEIRTIYETRITKDKIDDPAALEALIKRADVEARSGVPLKNARLNSWVADGTAIIPVEGVIGKKMNLFTRISGGTSTQMIGQDFATALADPEVHSILLSIDSPGGTVDGTQALADQIFAARGKKPILAIGDGLMASAAYWIGSAADKVYTSGDTTGVGSIGVVAQHTDYSQAEHAAGIKVTEITAGKYKRVVSDHEPLSVEGRASIQEKVDHLYSVFVENVARHRGVDAETVGAKMADGKLFLGKQAVKAGLVDGVSTESALVSRLNQNFLENRIRAVALFTTERMCAYE